VRSFSGLLGTTLSAPANLVPGLVPSAAIKAKRCFFPASSWVYAFILTCDDKLAVWFKRRPRGAPRSAGRVPGICCLYPQSNAQLYNLAVGWGSAGRFVHKFLYRVRPYVPVAPPKSPCGGDCPPGVTVGCCTNALPETLYATLTNKTGGCGCLPNSVTLSWNGVIWIAMFNACGVNGIDLRFACTTPSDIWNLSSNDLSSTENATSVVCQPFSVTFAGFNFPICLGTADVTVTT
jgi:hypothetical protein